MGCQAQIYEGYLGHMGAEGNLRSHSGTAQWPLRTHRPSDVHRGTHIIADRQQQGRCTLPTKPSHLLVSRWGLGQKGRISKLTLATVRSVPSSESKKMAKSLGKRSWENLNICPNNWQSLTSKSEYFLKLLSSLTPHQWLGILFSYAPFKLFSETSIFKNVVPPFKDQDTLALPSSMLFCLFMGF